jgi:hypothetical protein
MQERRGPQGDLTKKYAQLVARTWLDEEFKQRLIDNPEDVLKEQGFDVPEGGAQVTIDSDRLHLDLRSKPASLEGAEMSVEQLTEIVRTSMQCGTPPGISR